MSYLFRPWGGGGRGGNFFFRTTSVQINFQDWHARLNNSEVQINIQQIIGIAVIAVIGVVSCSIARNFIWGGLTSYACVYKYAVEAL